MRKKKKKSKARRAQSKPVMPCAASKATRRTRDGSACGNICGAGLGMIYRNTKKGLSNEPEVCRCFWKKSLSILMKRELDLLKPK